MTELEKAAARYLEYYEKKRWPPDGGLTAMQKKTAPSKVMEIEDRVHNDVGIEDSSSIRQVCDLIAEVLYELASGEDGHRYWERGTVPKPLTYYPPESELCLWRDLWEREIPHPSPRERVRESVVNYLKEKDVIHDS